MSSVLQFKEVNSFFEENGEAKLVKGTTSDLTNQSLISVKGYIRKKTVNEIFIFEDADVADDFLTLVWDLLEHKGKKVDYISSLPNEGERVFQINKPE